MDVFCEELIDRGKDKDPLECAEKMRPVSVNEDTLEVTYYCEKCKGSQVVKVDRIEYAWQYCPSCMESGGTGRLLILSAGQLVQGYDHEQTYKTQCLDCGDVWLVEAMLRPEGTYRGRAYCKTEMERVA